MSEWKEYYLEDVCEVIRGGSPRPIMKFLTTSPNGINWIKIGDVSENDRYFTHTKEKIIRDGVSSSREVIIGDLILSNSMSFGRPYIMKINGCIHDGWLRLRNNKKVLIKEYLYYFLCSNVAQGQMYTIAAGSVVNNLKSDTVKKIKIPIPSLPTQNIIVDILSSLDDKIDILHQQNKTLEAMAEALFRQWFVEEASDDWEEGKLGDYVIIKRGGSPRPIQDYISETGYKWLKISDVTSLNSPYIFEIKESIKEDGLNKTVYLKSGALVLSNSATPGIPKILTIDTCIHDGWLYFQDSYFSNEFLYLFFRYIQPQLVSQGNGSIFINLKTDLVKDYKLNIPKKNELENFQKSISHLFNKLLSNTNQIRTLEKLQDTLLPKLMSGEVRVTV